MKLTQQQVIFLHMAKQGTAPRSLSNKTGKALKAKGLVNYSIGFGYYCTEAGIEQLKQYVSLN